MVEQHPVGDDMDVVAQGVQDEKAPHDGRFNELCNQWHANHYFHHHPTSITGLWLFLFIAHALFHCFLRNLKPCRRKGVAVRLWAIAMLAEFLRPLFSSA